MSEQRASIVITGFDRSKAAFDSFTRNAELAQSRIGGLVGGLGKLALVGTAVSVGLAALGNIKTINLLDQLDELAEKSGINVERLSELRYASEVAGTPFEALTGGLSKLSKQMAAAAGGSKEAAATFETLGVSVKNADGSLRSSDAVLKDVADRFATYKDGAAKAALAQGVFGKSGADLIPILNQGAAGIEKLGQEAKQLGAVYDGSLAKQAADFNDNLTRLKLASEAAAVAIAGPLIGALSRMSTELVASQKIFGGYFEAFMQIGFKTSPFDNWTASAKSAQDEVARLGKEIERLESGQRPRAETGGGAALIGPSGSGRSAARLAAARQELIDAQKRQEYFQTLIDSQAVTTSPPAVGGQKDAPVIAAGGGAAEKDDPTKKLLDNQLKVWERAIAEQEKLLGQRNKFLDLYNSQGLLSVERYYDAQQAALDDAVAAQVKGYNAQLQALKDYQAKAAKAMDKAEAQGKIDALEAKRAELLQEAGIKALELDLKRGEAKKELLKTEKDITAQFAELNGNLVQAAGLKFDAQFEKAAEIFRANLLPGMTDMLARMREITVAQAQINAVTQKFSVIQGDLQMAEERITMALERGTMGQITALQRSGEVRRKAYADMQEQLQRYVDLESRVGLTDEQRQSFERLKLQAEQLGTTLDPFANLVNASTADAAGAMFRDVLSGSKSAKDAVNDFGDSVYKTINDLVSKQLGNALMKSLFGDSSGGGGLGGFVSQLFGGGGGGKAGGGGGGLFDWFAGFFAEGGDIPAGKAGIVGEKGMELIEGPATVTPLHKLPSMGRSVTQHVTYQVQGRIDRQTQTQLAQMNRRALESAGRLA